MENKQKYRLVTRSNLDGIVSAVLLKKLDIIDEILFVHPKDVQDGKVVITMNDIVTNLPYVKSAYMAFDHKLDAHDKNVTLNANHALYTDAGSVSEIIYEYYGGKEVFSDDLLVMIEAANRSKVAKYLEEEICSPQGWTLLDFLTDSRTGLGRFRDFRISNYALMRKLIDLCSEKSIDEVLQSEDIKARVELYHQHEDNFTDQLKRCVRVIGDVGVIDLSEEEIIYPGNRFMIYVLFPEISTSIHILQGVENKNTVFALGKSIFNQSNKKDIYEIVSKHGGGGHVDAGTCQVPHEDKENVLIDLLTWLNTK